MRKYLNTVIFMAGICSIFAGSCLASGNFEEEPAHIVYAAEPGVKYITYGYTYKAPSPEETVAGTEDTQPSTESKVEDLTEASSVVTQASIESPTVSQSAVVKVPQSVAALPYSMIYIGDSRAKAMDRRIETDFTYIAESSVNFDWFMNTAVPKLREMLSVNPAAKVIFGLGINDCISQTHGASYDVDVKYFEELNKLIDEYPFAKFYVLSVTPVDKDYVTHKTKRFTKKEDLTRNIEAFNAIAKASSKAKYIDGYAFMNAMTFETIDGIHYTTESYKSLYDYILGEL